MMFVTFKGCVRVYEQRLRRHDANHRDCLRQTILYERKVNVFLISSTMKYLVVLFKNIVDFETNLTLK